jgi:hypothetical protein
MSNAVDHEGPSEGLLAYGFNDARSSLGHVFTFAESQDTSACHFECGSRCAVPPDVARDLVADTEELLKRLRRCSQAEIDLAAT